MQFINVPYIYSHLDLAPSQPCPAATPPATPFSYNSQADNSPLANYLCKGISCKKDIKKWLCKGSKKKSYIV